MISSKKSLYIYYIYKTVILCVGPEVKLMRFNILLD